MADGVQQFGVEPIVKGLANFLTGLAQANSAMQQLGNAAQVVGGKFQLMGATWDSNVGRFRNARGQFVATADVLGAYTQAVNSATQETNTMLVGMAQMATGLAFINGAASTAAGSQQHAASAAQNAAAQTTLLTNALAVGKVAFSVFSVAAEITMGVLGKLGEIIGDAVDRVKNFAGKIAGFFGDIIKFTTSLLGARAIEAITAKIREFGLETLKAVGAFQELSIRFTTLAQRDIANERLIPIRDALGEASIKAQQLLEWTKRIAVTTPFSVKDIATSLALANSYGIQTGAARELISATIDFASAMGLNEDHMYRIIYNFGQMASQGKLTGREFRDLAISFVPIEIILREMAKEKNMPTEQFRKLALEGGVPVTEFFRKFIDISKRDFPDAAKRMARTFTGVTNNLKDFFEVVLGTSILGPTFDRVTASLANSLDSMLTPAFLRSAKIIGGVLGGAFDRVTSIITQRLQPALQHLAQALGIGRLTGEKFAYAIAFIGEGIRAGVELISRLIDTIRFAIEKKLGNKKTAQQGYSWGYNMIAQFAKGMADAVALVVKVIVAISKIITGWFKGHSPPKIAPDIDDWGRQTGAEWSDGLVEGVDEGHWWRVQDILTKKLVPAATEAGKEVAKAVGGGVSTGIGAAIGKLGQFSAAAMTKIAGKFSSRDFEIFNDISDTVENFIRSLPNVPETGLIPRILGARKTIAEAVKGVREGLLSVADAANRVVKSTRGLSKEFKPYIVALFNAEIAQSNFNAVNDLSEDTLERNRMLLSKISGDLRGLANSYVAAMEDFAAANVAADEAQRVLNETTQKYDRILEQLRSQLEQVSNEFDEKQRLKKIQDAINSGLLTEEEKAKLLAERQAILLKQEIRRVEGQRDAEVRAAQDKVDATKAVEEAAQKRLEDTRRAVMELAQTQLDAAQEQLDASKALIDMQIRQNELIQEQIKLLESLAKQKAAGGGVGEGLGFENTLGNILDNLPNVEDLTDEINKVLAQAKKDFETWATEVKKIFEDAFKDLNTEELTKSLNDTGTAVNDWANKDLAPSLTNAMALWHVLQEIATRALDSIADSVDRIKKSLGIGEAVGGSKDPGKGSSVLGVLLLLAQLPYVFITSSLAGLGEAIKSVADALEQWRKTDDELNKQWEEGNIFEKIESNVMSLWNTISTVFTGIGGAILGFIAGWVGTLIVWFTELYNKLVGKSIVPDMMDEIFNIISTKLDDIVKDVEGFFSTMVTTFTQKLEDIKTKWSEAWQAVKDKITEMWSGENGIPAMLGKGILEIKVWIETILGKVIKTFTDEILTPFEKGWSNLVTALKNAWSWMIAVRDAVLAFDLAKLAKLFGLIGGGGGQGTTGTNTGAGGRNQTGALPANRSTGRVQAGQRAVGNTTNVVNVTVNASYAQTQSAARIYHDVSAALAATNL